MFAGVGYDGGEGRKTVEQAMSVLALFSFAYIYAKTPFCCDEVFGTDKRKRKKSE